MLVQPGAPHPIMGTDRLELLRLPLHLALFAEVIHAPEYAPFVFATSNHIFAAYWDLKRKAVATRAGPGEDQWVPVLDRLCDKMTERQTLFALETEVLDDHERTVRAMESENVLVLDCGRVGFFHEGFFDYAFARRFETRGGDLIQYLKNGEQGLFKRAPLRQILLHTHATDHIGFVRSLRRVILDASIRFHQRRCALEVSARIECASPELWELFQDVLACAEPALVREVWRVLWVADPWFLLLHEKGLIAAWLRTEDPEQRHRAMTMVRNHIKMHPRECVDLLSPYVGVSDNWNAEIIHILRLHVLAIDRSVFDLFLRIHSAGAFQGERNEEFWLCMHDLPKHQPDWAAEALGQYLRNVVVKIEAVEVRSHFIQDDGPGEHLVLEIADMAPAEFLRKVLPVFIEVVQRTARERDGKLTIDQVWYVRNYREEHLSIEESLLQGIENSFKTLAKTSVSDYFHFLNILKPYGDYDSVNFIIVCVLAVAPREFADQTVEYLLANPQRLECGWTCGGGGEFSYWAARELVTHVASQCTDEAFAILEAHIVDYFPCWEKSKSGFKQRGYWQMVMLPALPAGRIDRETESTH
ncbi:MAG: hypothetical protein U1G05_00325 [Kiritimatiellia bacterium]